MSALHALEPKPAPISEPLPKGLDPATYPILSTHWFGVTIGPAVATNEAVSGTTITEKEAA